MILQKLPLFTGVEWVSNEASNGRRMGVEWASTVPLRKNAHTGARWVSRAESNHATRPAWELQQQWDNAPCLLEGLCPDTDSL